jgi:hypothetical protein
MILDRRNFLIGSSAALLGLAVGTLPARAAETIKIRDIYKNQNEFSDTAKRLAGKHIEIPGFMAPPLKADANFFVLTKRPMSVCPFCETSADWPNDIVFVRMHKKLDAVRFNRPIIARGVLELGVAKDQETGFVSLVRLVDASFDLV